jgi:hypothetical protein
MSGILLVCILVALIILEKRLNVIIRHLETYDIDRRRAAWAQKENRLASARKHGEE